MILLSDWTALRLFIDIRCSRRKKWKQKTSNKKISLIAVFLWLSFSIISYQHCVFKYSKNFSQFFLTWQNKCKDLGNNIGSHSSSLESGNLMIEASINLFSIDQQTQKSNQHWQMNASTITAIPFIQKCDLIWNWFYACSQLLPIHSEN